MRKAGPRDGSIQSVTHPPVSRKNGMAIILFFSQSQRMDIEIEYCQM